MSGRLHERNDFYKYATHATALLVIKSKSFRWSAPTHFNDPFDHQTELVLDIEQEHFAELLTASFERQIFGDMSPKKESTSAIAQMIRQTRANRDRLPRDETMNFMRQQCREMARSLPQNLDDLNTKLQEFLSNFSIFSVCPLWGPLAKLFLRKKTQKRQNFRNFSIYLIFIYRRLSLLHTPPNCTILLITSDVAVSDFPIFGWIMPKFVVMSNEAFLKRSNYLCKRLYEDAQKIFNRFCHVLPSHLAHFEAKIVGDIFCHARENRSRARLLCRGQ